MKTEELQETLRQHAKWLRSGGGGGLRADLRFADLRFANLREADLRFANLGAANLREADLRAANLRGANLREANLGHAHLHDAEHGPTTRWPSPTVMLLACWGALSDGLTRDLMQYDAACHPDPQAFQSWADGGDCPYDEATIGRAANFEERRECWDPNARLTRPHDLAMRCLSEACTFVADEE